MMIDASSRNRVKLNTNPNKRVELVPVGYGMVVSYENMATELFNKLFQVQKYSHPRDTIKFFNHSISLFGGIMDAQFVTAGHLIAQTESAPDVRYKRLLLAFNKLLSRKSSVSSPYATISYKPTWTPPYNVQDVVNAKKHALQEVSESWQPDFTM